MHKLFVSIDVGLEALRLSNPCAFQYIVKPPQSPASAFPWHRDSDWLDDGAVTRHPYISVRSCIASAGLRRRKWPVDRRTFQLNTYSVPGVQVWCALHDMTEGAHFVALRERFQQLTPALSQTHRQ